MKYCGNCKNRYFSGWYSAEPCIGYELAADKEAEKTTAENCENYEEGTPACLEEERYTPSSTGGDYSPSSPWNAPGMSVSDFI